MAAEKLRELDDRIREIQRARTALQQMLGAPHDHLDDCPERHRILRARRGARHRCEEQDAGDAGDGLPTRVAPPISLIRSAPRVNRPLDAVTTRRFEATSL
jgi:hypothetical protein